MAHRVTSEISCDPGINIFPATSHSADSLIKLSGGWAGAAHKGKHNEGLMFLPSLRH